MIISMWLFGWVVARYQMKLQLSISYHILWQINIVPKPELRGFWGRFRYQTTNYGVTWVICADYISYRQAVSSRNHHLGAGIADFCKPEILILETKTSTPPNPT